MERDGVWSLGKTACHSGVRECGMCLAKRGANAMDMQGTSHTFIPPFSLTLFHFLFLHFRFCYLMSEKLRFTRYDDGLGYTMDMIFGLKFSRRVSNKGIGGHTF